MAFLMLLHQKMSLQRKKTKLTYKQLRVSSSLDRVTKRIANVQKMYQKKISSMNSMVDMQVKRATASVKNWQSQMFTGGASIFGYGNNFGSNFGAYNSTTAFMNNILSGFMNVEKDNKQQFLEGSIFSGIHNAIQGGGQWKAEGEVKTDENGKIIGKGKIGDQEFEAAEWYKYQQQMQMAQQMQAMAQQNSNQLINDIEQAGVQEKERLEAILEAEQEEMLAPLHDMETEYQCDKTATDAQLELIKEQLQTIQQEFAQSVKDSAPKFGLA